ncbi:CDP-glycerol glycerophosphotransferase family protein [Streptomyces sp. NPDC001941]|uniref:CDP-glycerol glycerophosphotransferase family protein n=1 Tax=Streptomyces sp. NPDC001941 TaxID=3154659 RepID=UPI0033234685
MSRPARHSVPGPPHPGLDVVVTTTGEDRRAIAERLSVRDPRFTVVALPPGTPDAAARAAGARAAGGRHLQFLHGSDWLPGATTAPLADWLRGLGEAPGAVLPDVVLLDHHRAYWWDQAVPGGDTALLTRGGPAAALLGAAPLLGNRLVSARLFAAHAEEFGTEGADELFLSYAVLLLADRVACRPQVALVHRRGREDGRRPRTAEDHRAVLRQYDLLHALEAVRTAPAVVRARLYDRMTGDHLAVLARRGALPRAFRAEYFRRAADQARRLRPAGHRRPRGLAGLRQRLLGHGARTVYRLLQAANDRRRGLRSLLARRAHQVARLRDRRHYRRQLRRRIDPDLAVFSAYWGRGVACNPAAIAAELAELAPDIRRVWVVEAQHAPLLPPGTEHVVPGTRAYWRTLARAKYLVNNVNFPNPVVKRPGSVHLQTHHGTPLKRMGLDQREYPAAAQGTNFRTLLARVDRWDYSLSSNPHSTEAWQRAYPADHVSLDYGYPRNDVYYRATAEDVRAARARLGLRDGQRALLYAPTHRDHETGWTPRLDLALLADRLGEDTVLLVRGHYFYDSPLPAAVREKVLDVSAYDPVEELALAADALITDYSSIMFDYANLDRPIVIHADDWDVYRTVRGVYFDLLAEAPGPVARSQAELTDILTGGAWCDETAAKQRAGFRRRFCAYDDGRAAERVVRRVFLGEGEESLPPVLPPGRRTPAPTPQEAARR